jgi:hypothetical protein
MYPNPNNGQFLINILGMNGEKMSYNILDASGRVVSNWTIHGNPMQLDLSSFANGNYSLKISGSEKQILKKIQIKR